MKTADSDLIHLKTLRHRLSAAGIGLIALVAAFMTPFYGVIFITNGLTQIQHLGFWSYLAIMMVCYSMLVGLMCLMLHLMVKNWKYAWQ